MKKNLGILFNYFFFNFVQLCVCLNTLFVIFYLLLLKKAHIYAFTLSIVIRSKSVSLKNLDFNFCCIILKE